MDDSPQAPITAADEPRGRARRRARLALVTVIAALLSTACLPTVSRTDYQGVAGGRKVNVLGHSIPTSARTELAAGLGRTHLIAFDTADGRTIPQASASIDWVVAERSPVVVVALGENELSTGRSQAELRRRVRTTLVRLARTPCVVWVDIRDRAVPWYRIDWQAQAEAFNAWLPGEVAQHPNSHAASWSSWSRAHPDWFVADLLHLTAAGRAAYGAFVTASVLDHCGGPVAGTPVSPNPAGGVRGTAATENDPEVVLDPDGDPQAVVGAEPDVAEVPPTVSDPVGPPDTAS